MEDNIGAYQEYEFLVHHLRPFSFLPMVFTFMSSLFTILAILCSKLIIDQSSGTFFFQCIINSQLQCCGELRYHSLMVNNIRGALLSFS